MKKKIGNTNDKQRTLLKSFNSVCREAVQLLPRIVDTAPCIEEPVQDVLRPCVRQHIFEVIRHCPVGHPRDEITPTLGVRAPTLGVGTPNLRGTCPYFRVTTC